MVILNETLASKQNITNKQRNNLNILYNELEDLIMRANNDKDIKTNGPSYATDIRELEFKLQKNWNFPLDPLKHTWWNKFNKCTCPKMDNDERFGLAKIHNSSCPFHGFDINVKVK